MSSVANEQHAFSAAAVFSRLAFRYPFRPSQEDILARIEEARRKGDHKFHIVAPPGSGKTIVGLELIRRLGRPAVVFVPNTALQLQWRERLRPFLPEESDLEPGIIVSLEPERIAPINVFTYQIISTPAEARQHLRTVARQRWVADLVESGVCSDEAAAQARLEALQADNPREYRRELNRYLRRLRREFLQEGRVPVGAFLHANARQLIERLVAAGVGTVVLDECHHLLDYWAIVTRYLLSRLEEPYVIGLTATLPAPDNPREYENYTALLGEVDFEIPTPAVVREGNLVPYRDLVYFVEPSVREQAYLHNLREAFAAASRAITGSERFRAWATDLVGAAAGDLERWGDFLNEDPVLAVALLRFLTWAEISLPAQVPVPVEAREPLSFDDWLVLLEQYALRVLKLSPDPEAHQQLQALRRVLASFGFSLTERGLRQHRSAGDLVLALSESKDGAVLDILMAEHGALGDRLRAVVVTDFERMTSGVARAKDVLDRDAGSARRVYARIVRSPFLRPLTPVLMTARTLMVPREGGEALLDFLRQRGAEGGFAFELSVRSADEFTLTVRGTGRDWRPRTYVHLVTAAFQAGLTRCLVSTRGLIGEGWDAPALNTLIDLTGVTTAVGVRQLRGRTLRKDPRWPHKVAHHWDIVCVAPEFERGDVDLQRFVRRHRKYWGVVPPTPALEPLLEHVMPPVLAESVARSVEGQLQRGKSPKCARIVRGVSHVDPDLAYELSTKPFHAVDFAAYNRRMMSWVAKREETYALWCVGQPYTNTTRSTLRCPTQALRLRTVATVQHTLARLVRAFVPTLAWGTLNLLVSLWWNWWRPLTSLKVLTPGTLLGLMVLAAFVVTLWRNGRSARKLARAMLVEQPPDAILGDVGRAVLEALQANALVPAELSANAVRVDILPDGSAQVRLETANAEAAAHFAEAVRQIFAPVRNQRYLIWYDDRRLPAWWLLPLWWGIRPLVRRLWGSEPAYYPVPDVLATNKERAQRFAEAWRAHVGGGTLVYTRTPEGRRVLLKARAQHRPQFDSLAFEVWM